MSKTLTVLYERFWEATAKLKAEYGSTVQWLFSVEAAAWWGAFWERLIHSVKRAIDRVRLVSANSYESILTVLREAQLMINSRPLLHGSSPYSLTSAHLLYGRPSNQLPSVNFPLNNKDGVYVDYTRLQLELERFWDIRTQEYLVSLRTYKWGKPTMPKLNDLVVIQENSKSGYNWQLGRSRKLIQSLKDGYIRVAEPHTGGLLRRTLHKLIHIEHLARPRRMWRNELRQQWTCRSKPSNSTVVKFEAFETENSSFNVSLAFEQAQFEYYVAVRVLPSTVTIFSCESAIFKRA